MYHMLQIFLVPNFQEEAAAEAEQEQKEEEKKERQLKRDKDKKKTRFDHPEVMLNISITHSIYIRFPLQLKASVAILSEQNL